MKGTKAERPHGRVNTLDEVAAVLRISRGSAYQAAKRNEIPTIKIGRRILVPSDALERLLSGPVGAAVDQWATKKVEFS
jgi:excisionase family DNA binding protein